jgi:hypothetical protein
MARKRTKDAPKRKGTPEKPLAYDPRRAPDKDRWMASDELERLVAVRRVHVTPPLPHDLPRSLDAHVAVHAVIETQLATGDPPEAQRALGRLLSEGVSRHDAIHAIGTVFASAVWEISQGKPTNFDAEAYKRALGELDYAQWRELVDGTPAPKKPKRKPPAAKARRARKPKR